MKKIDLGQTIGILANAGVVAGIFFLVLELRQNSEQLSAQSRYNYYQNRISEYRLMAENPELAELMTRANGGEELSIVERNRVSQRMYALITGWEYEFGELESGRLSEEEFNVVAKRELFQRLGALGPIWAEYRRAAPPSFAKFMDQNIAMP